MLEHLGTKRFLKNRFSLAFAHGRYRRSCFQKCAASTEPDSDWTSQPIQTLIKSPESEVPRIHEFSVLSSSVSVRSELVLRDSETTAVMKLLVQYSRSPDSSYEVSFKKARVTDLARDLVSCEFTQGAVESSYRLYVRIKKKVRRFPKPLSLDEKQNDRAPSEHSSAARGALSVTPLSTALLEKGDEHGLLLYNRDVTALTRCRKQTATFNSRAFFLYALSFLRKLRSKHSTVWKKHPFIFNPFLLSEVPQTKSFMLLVKAMFSSTMSLSFYDPADKTEALDCTRQCSRSRRCSCT